jgi:Protein of unknown function (DUF3631)
MRRRAPDEAVAEFRERDVDTKAQPLKQRIESWAEKNLDNLTAARPAMPEGVRDRPAEVWEALLAVADVAGGQWPQRARAACRHFVLNSDPDELSFGTRLLRDVRTAFADCNRMFSAELVAALTANGESEWTDLWSKPLDQNRLAGTETIRGALGHDSDRRTPRQGLPGGRQRRAYAGVAPIPAAAKAFRLDPFGGQRTRHDGHG